MSEIKVLVDEPATVTRSGSTGRWYVEVEGLASRVVENDVIGALGSGGLKVRSIAQADERHLRFGFNLVSPINDTAGSGSLVLSPTRVVRWHKRFISRAEAVQFIADSKRPEGLRTVKLRTVDVGDQLWWSGRLVPVSRVVLLPATFASGLRVEVHSRDAVVGTICVAAAEPDSAVEIIRAEGH